MSSGEHSQQGMGTLSTESQILVELQTLAYSPGFIYTLAHAAAADTFVRQEGSVPYDRLNVKELTLVAGLMAIQPFDAIDIPDEEELTAQIAHLYTLLKKLHEVVAQPMTDGAVSKVAAKLSANATESNVPLSSPSGSEMVDLSSTWGQEPTIFSTLIWLKRNTAMTRIGWRAMLDCHWV